MPINNWSYSGDPTASPLDEVRFLCGDTNPDAKLVSDDEINYALKLAYGATPPAQGNFLAAVFVTESIAATFTGLVDESVGDLHVSYSQRAKQYDGLLKRLRRRANLAGVVTFMGGQSKAGKRALNADTDRVQPAITIDGMNDSDSSFPQVPGEPR